MSGELNVSSSNSYNKCTFKSTLYSESSMRLKLGETGDVTTESALFPFPQWAYRAWSNIGQRLLGRNSISQNNLEIRLKSIIIKNSTSPQSINPQSSIDSFIKAGIGEIKNQEGGKITIKDMIELQVELLMMQTHFEEYLASDKGKNSKAMLKNILNQLNSQLSGSEINNKKAKQTHEEEIEGNFVKVLRDFHSEIHEKVKKCSLSKNDYLKYVALTDKSFDCCNLKGHLQKINEHIRSPLYRLCTNKKLGPYIELPESLKTKFEDNHKESIHRLSGNDQFPKSNIFSNLPPILQENANLKAKRMST